MAALGAGTKVYIGTAAAPNNAAHGGSADDADLTDISDLLKSFSLTGSQGTVDVTCLNADANGYNKSFIAALNDAKVNAEYIDDATLAAYKRFQALQQNTASAVSRGMFDVKVLVGGATEGNARLDFTMSIDSLPLNVTTEAAFGGPLTGQITGAVTVSTQ